MTTIRTVWHIKTICSARRKCGGQFLGNGNNPRRSVSDATAQAIDKEVRDLVDDAHETALNILRNNLPLLESISQKILQEEVIEGEDLKTLLAESKMPA